MANLEFASKTVLRRYHQSLSRFARNPSIPMLEAVEFTRLAAKRWRYYSRLDEAAENFAGLRLKIRHAAKSEVAFIMVASIRQDRRELPVGLAYCRRTWCHHLALDYLALHPRAMDERWQMRGIGSGIIFGLVQLARILKVQKIWGEATANSAPFYEKLLAISPVRDLFIIERQEMISITKRQEKIHNPLLVTGRRLG